MGGPQSKTEVMLLFMAGTSALLFITALLYLLRHWR